MNKTDCRDAALKYLALSDKTAYEMKRRLTERGYDEKEIEETLRFLCELHYIDDFEYAMKYLRLHVLGKGRGLYGTKRKLTEKGIDRELLEDAVASFLLEEGLSDEKERALAVADRLLGDGEPNDHAIAKAAGKLVSMGYDSESVYGAVGMLMNKKGRAYDE